MQLRAWFFSKDAGKDSAEVSRHILGHGQLVSPRIQPGGVRQRGKSGAGHISQGGGKDTIHPALSRRASVMDPVNKLRLETPVLSQRDVALFRPFSIPRRRGPSYPPCQHLPSCPLPLGRKTSAWQACAAGAESGIGAVTCLRRTPSAWQAGLATGFSHPLLGLDHLLLAGTGSGLRLLHQLNAVAPNAWQALALGSLFGTSAVASCPGGTGRGPGLSAARLLILPAGAPPGRRPARHPLRAGGMITRFRSPFTKQWYCMAHEAKWSQQLWLGDFLALNLVVWPSVMGAAQARHVWTLRLAGLLAQPRWRGPRPGQSRALAGPSGAG